MRPALVFLLVLGSGELALAQERPGEGEILIDATGPEAHHERRKVPLPPEGPGRDAFLRDFMVVNMVDNEVRLGSRILPASEFYTRIERTDLVAQAEDRTRQRVWLMAGGGVVAVASVVGGIVVMSTAQNTNDPGCSVSVPAHNACLDSANHATTAGTILLGAGLALGTGLITWGALIPEMVTSPQETLRLAADYNLALARKHGATGARLQLVPSLAPGYAGLTARLTL
ncbi:MAG TPA: hypothetical protein VMT11_09860 [Myxococcaceae bacterium]|nr:hypothetical protein [Myxococcaceae bacterium]